MKYEPNERGGGTARHRLLFRCGLTSLHQGKEKRAFSGFCMFVRMFYVILERGVE